MKRLLALLLVAALTLSLAACGGASITSKEELEKDAASISFKELALTYESNKASAIEKYNNTDCIITGFVYDIGDDSVTIRWVLDKSDADITEEELSEMFGENADMATIMGTAFMATTFSLDVKFANTDEIANLKIGDEITVIGKLVLQDDDGVDAKNIETAYIY